jgi:hypothetical protein
MMPRITSAPRIPQTEDAMLVLLRHLEVGEDQDEDEDVVDAERVLDQVAGKEFERRFRPLQLPDEEIETEGKQHPRDAPRGCFLDRDDVRLAIESDEVDRQHDEDTDVKCDPEPEWQAARVPCGISSRKPKERSCCWSAQQPSFLWRAAAFAVASSS